MTEHKRANGYQWCDTERYMVIDRWSGIERSDPHGWLLTKEQAFEYVLSFRGWEDRKLIVRVDAIAAFKLES